MNRRIILIIAAALAFALLVGFVWWWFFTGTAQEPAQTGGFGSGVERPAGSGTGVARPQTNTPSGVIGAGTGGNTSAGSLSGAGGIQIVGPVGSVPGVTAVPGVEWLGGGTGGSAGTGYGGGPTTSFVPKSINQLNSGSVSGSPYIFSGGGGSSGEGGSQGSGLGGALLGAGIAGAVSCGLFLIPGVGSAPSLIPSVYVKNSADDNKSFLDCIARTIAKVAIQQITSSIVNWINSGFDGQPSFVRNYEQFFTNVADRAAGEFIKGSSLSFLCSPFQLQIRIALAQSYARRGAASCSLSGVIRNINSFMGGNFSAGGWAGLLSFTNVPTNNPFGAYAYAQAGLSNAQNKAVQLGALRVSPEGYLAYEEDYDCRTVAVKDGTGEIIGSKREGCKKRITTPGSTIAGVVNDQLKLPQDSLNLAKSFDEIISALITQLTTRVLQGGLSNASGEQGYASNFYTPGEQQAQTEASALLTDMQGKVQLAQQYGSAQQGGIADIQNTQRRLQDLANCWEVASSSPSNSIAKQKQAQANAAAALILLNSYNADVDLRNNNITRANAGIAKLQDLQTRIIGVSSAGEVASASAEYSRALASGAIITQADVTTALQDRTSLQTALNNRDQLTATELSQCHAY